MGSNAAAQARTSYASLQNSSNADAIAYGVKTIEGFIGSSSKTSSFTKPQKSSRTVATDSTDAVDTSDFKAPHIEQTYLVCVDPNGELNWKTNTFKRSGKPDAHVIELISETTSPDYRNHLQELGISYIVAGKEALDLPLAAEKLLSLFGIKKMLLCGGGITNKTFLNAGIIDELSIVVAPVISGEQGVATLFDSCPAADKKNASRKKSTPQSFNLIYVESLPGNTVHLRYGRNETH